MEQTKVNDSFSDVSNVTVMNDSCLAPPPSEGPVFNAAQTLRDVYIWILCLLGLPGSAAAVATILSMRVTTATFYVALLAVVDGTALVLKLIFHQLSTYDALPVRGAGCRILTMVVELCSCWANWVLVLICFERFVSVRFPIQKRFCFTKKRAYVTAAVVFLVMFVSFTPFLYAEGYCNCIHDLYRDLEYKDAWLAVQTALYFVLPFIAVAILATLIIVYLVRHRRRRHAKPVCGDDGGSTERAMSVMMVSAAVAFLVLTLPTCVYYLIPKRMKNQWRLADGVVYMLFQVTTALADANHAVNFYIYFLSAARFRNRFKELIRADKCSRCPVTRKADAACTADVVTMETSPLNNRRVHE
ncbi:hypothetical protein BaRGS_00000102 [Batillaria attramentaria]|uniref:G-protein coupled receptors family 1 profile domain-containing protein n=1 Tax=Batillaria attramentaria TaxID=370345 RepID=A0ABD0MBG0_9CAEN|nr:hypothetical protein BaRGS_018597 [Batillaria attramentaria]